MSGYPTDTVMCSACSGTGEYDWGEIDVFSRCGTCGGRGELEVCAQCHDSGDDCAACMAKSWTPPAAEEKA